MSGTRLVNVFLVLVLRLVRLYWGRKIAVAVKNPMRVQHLLLMRIVRQNKDTTFGRKWRFDEVACYADFARCVPVGDYESLRPYIDEEIEHRTPALTTESPHCYARTSGTTGRPKDIPITRSYLAALRGINHTAVSYQQRVCPEAFAGSILVIHSPAEEGTLANDKPFGSASGMVAGATPALIRDKYVVPNAVFSVADSRVKYLLILRLAMARPDITYIGTANPTTLLTLIKLYREYEVALLKDLKAGGFFLFNALSNEVQSAIASRLSPRPARAADLERVHTADCVPRFADLWPALRLVVVWTCASASIASTALRRELPLHARMLELGYLSSEFRGTFTIGKRAGSGLPTLDTHFFEFVERDSWDRREPEFLTIDRIRKGRDYYVVVTTPSGLYRYFINDLVRVTGHLHHTPLIRFVRKGKGVTNITGEKLYENQVLEAVQKAVAEVGVATQFVTMLADEVALCYRLYVETAPGTRPNATRIAQSVDARLMELNIEYLAKRESQRLCPVTAHWLAAGTADAYKQFCVQKGQREGQFKFIALAYRKDVIFDLDARVEAD